MCPASGSSTDERLTMFAALGLAPGAANVFNAGCGRALVDAEPCF
jgi:hypothetical protein